MHTETGYIRVRSTDSSEQIVEFLVCDPTGVTSVFDGKILDNDNELVIDFTSTNVIVTPSTKPVSAIERKYTFTKTDPSKFCYQINMKAVDQEMQSHLSAELKLEKEENITISKEEFKNLDRSNVILLDVREPEEFEEGHFDDAVNSPVGRFLKKSGQKGTTENNIMNDGKKIIVYCASGGRAKIATNSMRNRGITQAFACADGYGALKE